MPRTPITPVRSKCRLTTTAPGAPTTPEGHADWEAPDGATITMAVRNTTGGLPILVVEVERGAPQPRYHLRV